MPVRRHPIALTRPGVTPELPLDRSLINRLAASYARLRRHDDRLAHLFYAKLFAAAPHLRPMFRESPAAQARKLMAALDLVVRNFERPAETAAIIADMGRRHAAYGAKPEHYDLVAELLTESMAELFGPTASTRELDEWRTALRLISDHMIAASRGQHAPRA